MSESHRFLWVISTSAEIVSRLSCDESISEASSFGDNAQNPWLSTQALRGLAAVSRFPVPHTALRTPAVLQPSC
jgi:hypothetical protein